ncbi:MAG TPA: hypothetical protein VFA47_09180, partial [Candidatus Manganitrophaceae bacterium]|nr:hypothetical protein [Candidatus Manganitrophaceae bacterium]
QYFFIFLLLFWPLWAILFVFLRWLLKAELFPSRGTKETAVASNGGEKKRGLEKAQDLSQLLVPR